MAGRVVSLFADAGEFVPRADQLTIIATEDPVTHCLTELDRDTAAQLNGEIGDAAFRIHLIGRDKRIGRADIETGAAATAVVCCGFIDRQGQIGEKLTEEKPGAGLLVNQHRVLADPAQPGFLCQCPFQNRCAVDKRAIAELADF